MAMTDPKTGAARKGGILARFRSWFLTGLLVTAPVLLTVYITWTAVQLIDNQVAGLLPWVSQNSFTSLPGVGLIIGVVLITLIGAVAAGFLGRWIIRLGESILNRMPVVRSIYGAIKQILETVISTQSDAFREVILVEYPRRGMWVIGFVTGSTKEEVARRMDGEMVNVFVPTTPNPTSGFLLFCPRDEVIFMDMSVEDAVKLVVSGGIVTPPDDAAKGKSAKKAAVKQTAVKQTAVKQTAVKQTAVKQTAVKKTAAKKAVARKGTAKKTAARKAVAKKA